MTFRMWRCAVFVAVGTRTTFFNLKSGGRGGFGGFLAVFVIFYGVWSICAQKGTENQIIGC